MKIKKRIGYKIVKLSNMDDLIAEFFDGEDAEGNAVLFGKDIFLVNVLPANNPNNSLMNISPWIQFTADEFIPIYYDSIMTIVNPLPSFQEYYINVKKKWTQIDMDGPFRSHGDRLDELDEPTDEELDIIEALFDKKNTVVH